jgi:glycine/D-amino acid oxidase-like deaminating enzyme
MIKESWDVLIAGGGVIGSSVAYFLSAHPEAGGRRILVVERDPTYQRSSTALSVGGVRQQFSTPENIQLSLFSADFFRGAHEALAVGPDKPDLGFRETGYLFLCTSAGEPILRRLRDRQVALGAGIEMLTRQELGARFPWMDVSDLSCGSFGVQGEGWLDPFSLLQGFKAKAKALGVTFVQDEVLGFESAGDRIQEVRLSEHRAQAVGSVVNASGPAAGELALLAGIPDLPVRPKKRFVYNVRIRGELPGCPMVIDPSGVYFRPEGDGFLCGVSPPPNQDPDTLDLEMDYELFYDVVWPTLAKRVPAFDSLRLETSWAGHYAYNPHDQNAILGPHPRLRNFFFANGFSGHGLQHSPGIGRALSELLLFGEYRTLDLSRFGFQRFAEGSFIREENVV